MDLELVCVECYGLDRVLDLKIDIALALVCPWIRGLEVEEGDGVVGWLDAIDI